MSIRTRRSAGRPERVAGGARVADVALVDSNGAPLNDTNGDGTPDVGTGNWSPNRDFRCASHGPRVFWGRRQARSTSQRDRSSRGNVTATSSSNVVWSTTDPGRPDWRPPQHHRDAAVRVFGVPMSQLWTSPGPGRALFGPIYAEGKLSRRALTSSCGHGIPSWAPRSGAIPRHGSGIPFYTGWPVVAMACLRDLLHARGGTSTRSMRTRARRSGVCGFTSCRSRSPTRTAWSS